MANTNIQTEVVMTGVRLNVIVEYSFENIIAVYLLHNGKEYRGVLLETDPGLFPHGIPFSGKSVMEQKISLKNSPRSALDTKPGMENKPPDISNSFKDVKFELSASICRFSYNTNPFLTNPRPVPDTPTIEMKPVTVRRKTIRDIRLRPRQTLCFKCKAAIHENHKMHTSQSNTNSTASTATSKLKPLDSSTSRDTDSAAAQSTSSLPPVTRKRKKCLQSPMVLLEDIQLKTSKISHERSSKESSNVNLTFQRPCRAVKRSSSGNKLSDFDNRKPINATARSHRSSSSGSINTGNDFLQIIDDSENSKGNSLSKSGKKKCIISTTCNAKPSPAIKITIGDGAIIKIPPRLPDRGAEHIDEELPIPKLKILDSGPAEYHAHKKAKKAAKKSKDRDKSKSSAGKGESYIDLQQNEMSSTKSQKKHKKKHRHRHDSSVSASAYCEDSVLVPLELKKSKGSKDFLLPVSDGEEQNSAVEINSVPQCRDAENYENALPIVDSINIQRPRLVYTWRQNQGLSRVSSSPRESAPSVSPKYIIKSSPGIMPVGNSPHRRKNASPARVVSASPSWHFSPSPKLMLKDYPLRSLNDTVYSSGHITESVQPSDFGKVQTSEDSHSRSSEEETHFSDFSDDSGDCINDFFPGPQSPPMEDEDKDIIKPLMMKIQTQNVDGCVLEEGREIHVGDIVWGKIQGFPWWPGRVSNITVTQRDNNVIITRVANVAWFGSNTVSHMHCSDLFPFLEDFKTRYNKKKKGQYRVAIKQATSAAQRLAAESHREFLIEDYEL
ncbi:unnamed protein product [Candidula unifasciata]|uniref:PWWP domain-containing protein n=1 Tax=Candidula unifasciata TaxID=100452 RepID=A0A8S3ZAV9_9EUPU|nr:unnamed protein product [Candidula unifasciata]